jgi:tetratricopeptide (TPR) repeat protein
MTEDVASPASAAAKVLAEAAGTDQWKPVLRAVRRLRTTQSGHGLAHLESEIERMQHLLAGRSLDLDHSHRDQLIERFRLRVEDLLNQAMEPDELHGCTQLLEHTVRASQSTLDFTVVPWRDPGKVLQVDVRKPVYAELPDSLPRAPGPGTPCDLSAACAYSLIVESAVGRNWPILSASSSRLPGYYLRRSPTLDELVAPPTCLPRPQVYGRQETLDNLKRLTKQPDGCVHVISGASGTGKTAVALSLAAHARELNISVWWIRCHAGYTHAAMAALAFLLGANPRDLAEARAGRRSLRDLTWGLLEKAEAPWLMVLDDCGHEDTQASSSPLTWARPSSRGLVVVTTRTGAVPKGERRTQRYMFDSIPQKSRTELLVALAPHPGPHEQTDQLAGFLGGHPLTLSLWSAYLNLAGASAQSLIDYHGQPGQDIESTGGGLPAVTSGFLVDSILQALERQGIPQARPLLEILAHFAGGITLPEVILTSLNSGEPGLFPAAAQGSRWQADIQCGLDALQKAGLLERQDRKEHGTELQGCPVQVNSAVAEVCREQIARSLPSSLRMVRAAAAASIRAAVRKYLNTDESDWAGCALIVPHIHSLLETLQQGAAPEVAFEDAAGAACAVADFLLSTGAYQDAEHLARRAHDVSRLLKTDSPASLETRLCLASTLMARGRLGEAQEIAHHVLNIREQVLGPGHPETLRVLEKLALCLRDQGRLREAGLALRAVVAGRQRLLGEGNAETLRALSSLSAILWAQGKVGEAERSLRRVVEGRRRILKPDDPEVSAALADLATILRDRGRLREAEKALRRVLGSRERTFGKDDPDTLGVLIELAETLRGQGRLKEAETGLRRVLKVRKRTLGRDDPDTLEVEVALAETLREQGKPSDAVARLQHALDAQLRRLTANHPDVLNTQVCLAATYRDLGDLEDAEEALRSATLSYEDTVEPDHPIILCTKHDLAAVLQDMGRFDEAEEICKDVLDLREWTLGPNHPETLDTLANIGCLLRSRGALTEAQDAITHALTGYEDLLGPEHPTCLTIKSNLAGVLYEQGMSAEAAQMYDSVLAGREQVLGKKHPATQLARVNLAAALMASDRLGAAEKLLNDVLSMTAVQSRSAQQAMVAALYNLAVIYHRKQKFEAAEGAFREVVRIRTEEFGPYHPDTLAARNELARVLTAMGRHGEANTEYEGLLRGAERFVAAAGE